MFWPHSHARWWRGQRSEVICAPILWYAASHGGCQGNPIGVLDACRQGCRDNGCAGTTSGLSTCCIRAEGGGWDRCVQTHACQSPPACDPHPRKAVPRILSRRRHRSGHGVGHRSSPQPPLHAFHSQRADDESGARCLPLLLISAQSTPTHQLHPALRARRNVAGRSGKEADERFGGEGLGEKTD
jgi:hypothetical protein